jgi:hypothetical protein
MCACSLNFFVPTLGLGGFLAGLRAFVGRLRRGLGFGPLLGTLGGFLGLGRAIPLAGSLLGGSLLRRDVRALCRNGDGFVGGVGFWGCHSGEYLFLRLFRA